METTNESLIGEKFRVVPAFTYSKEPSKKIDFRKENDGQVRMGAPQRTVCCSGVQVQERKCTTGGVQTGGAAPMNALLNYPGAK